MFLRLALSCALALPALSSAALAGTLTDDLEGLTPGPLPQGIWEDMSTRVAGHTTIPTSDVISTTDAFGQPTLAIQTKLIFGKSTGFHTPVQAATFHDLTADVRVDSFGDGLAWGMSVGFTADDGASDINASPQCLIYPWFDGTWHLFVTEPSGGDFLLLGEPIIIGKWYTVQIQVDTTTGFVSTLVREADTGRPVAGGSTTIPNASTYDSLSFFDGEYADTGTISSQTTIDNIRYVASGFPCPADLSGDRNVDSTDLAIMLAAWDGSEADLDGDGNVGSGDLAILLAAWGECD